MTVASRPNVPPADSTVSRIVATAAAGIITMTAQADLDVRFKGFASGAAFPDHDVQRRLAGTPAYDYSADMRLVWRRMLGPNVRLLVDHTTLLHGGDTFAFNGAPQSTLDQTPTDDDARLAQLTWELDEGDRHRLLHRFDRLAVRYRSGGWAVTLGRQAVSWGSGQVFQPLDLFSPFAPTVVDRDYKAGDDLLLVERAFAGGGDVQVLAVGRRDAGGDISADASSFAVKGRTLIGDRELEAMVGRHYLDTVAGLTFRMPLGGALMRTDLLATHLRGGGNRLSGVINLDYSLLVAQKNVYVFGEYFHNDFGVRELPASPVDLPAALTDRLVRGELFNMMRDYLAGGIRIEWHPLWNQTLTVIGNLHDSSSLIQTQLSYQPGDNQSLDFGWVQPTGRAGDEFGGIPLGAGFTSGGGARGYVRWVYYL